MMGEKIFRSCLILFVSFFILAVAINYTEVDTCRWINKPLNIGFYGMIIGKLIKVWEN